jgi:hypothetical protein
MPIHRTPDQERPIQTVIRGEPMSPSRKLWRLLLRPSNSLPCRDLATHRKSWTPYLRKVSRHSNSQKTRFGGRLARKPRHSLASNPRLATVKVLCRQSASDDVVRAVSFFILSRATALPYAKEYLSAPLSVAALPDAAFLNQRPFSRLSRAETALSPCRQSNGCVWNLRA